MTLSTNVLCLKKRKKKTYSLSSTGKVKKIEKNGPASNSRSSGSAAVTMLQVTEDTPPDMLAGAMDLTVHLPTGKAVKMAVERSTPMMDLLVQITTNHQLQLSNYTLQALGMAPSSEHSDTILPYKPNTPIGTLDTQHIKVLPKSRPLPLTKNVPPGHQPFESTFRLKVHLPRNQLYVTRVSRNVFLEDIMKKVCDEKNLDPTKYEFKHPGNLDEVLDPKLTLSDYQITEIYVVSKGTASINQAFSTSDIMALRKEEERKQMHTKTGGGVFNLIFRRGKPSMGSGSISSDTRSNSPTQSDDSRSVTPPAIQQQILPPPKKEPPTERPKPPQRKRRPAPKPPQEIETSRRNSEDKPPSNISEVNELQTRRAENGLVICHSRNSSDSSGYHEASVLSENCNTSLPRRPKSAFVAGAGMEKMSKLLSQSTTNLTKMSSHSKSTTSLGIAGRKKKAAPPPPPVVHASNPAINIETPSPVVASQAPITQEDTSCKTQENLVAPLNSPIPLPRSKSNAPVEPTPRIEMATSGPREEFQEKFEISTEKSVDSVENAKSTKISDESNIKTTENDATINNLEETTISTELGVAAENDTQPEVDMDTLKTTENDATINNLEETTSSTELGVAAGNVTKPEVNMNTLEMKKNDNIINETIEENKIIASYHVLRESKVDVKSFNIHAFEKSTNQNLVSSPEISHENKPPEIVAVIPKTPKEKKITKSKFDSLGKRFQIGSSLTENFDVETASIRSRQSNDSKTESISTRNSVESALETFNFVDEFSDLDENVFSGSSIKKVSPDKSIFNQLYGIHHYEDTDLIKNNSVSSLRSLQSLPGFFSIGSASGMKKWNNLEDLGNISMSSLVSKSKWVIGDTSEQESFTSHDALGSLTSTSLSPNINVSNDNENKPFGSTDSGIAQDTIEKLSESEEIRPYTPPPPPLFPDEAFPESSTAAPPTVIKEESNLTPSSLLTEVEESAGTFHKNSNNPAQEKSELAQKELVVQNSTNVLKQETDVKDPELGDIDWEYQLPSPPKAFRDSSPVNVMNGALYESQSVTDFKDSVVTSPELFEKLQNIEDSQSERGTITSDVTSVASEDDKPLLNTLSLEHLEKRRSLVYNRELASLKMTDYDSTDSKNGEPDTFSDSLNMFESTYVEIQNSSQPKANEQKIGQKMTVTTHTTHALPNFKISTYDRPKQKFRVFEDDTVRSNTENFRKLDTTLAERSIVTPTLRKSFVGNSMENIYIKKNSNLSNEEEYTFFRPNPSPSAKSFGRISSVFRSESFSNENSWSSPRPVFRSKSHLTLNANKYKEENRTPDDESISRSNSLYDVSGLQSLGVMRLIQNKLSTPTSSMENINQQEKPQKALKIPETQKETVPSPVTVEEPPVNPPEKIYKYRGPPSINMTTWSERPKVPVSLKEDADYKLSNNNNNNNISSRLIVNTTNNNITSNNSIEVKNSSSSNRVNGFMQQESNSVNIKINGSESAINKQQAGNVVIKIGSLNSQPKTIDNQRFISHTTATGYRKPFSNINKNEQTQRPHSVAFGSDFDISRVPVVRSVEFKKQFRDMSNTSVTHIYPGDDFKSDTSNRTEPVSELRNKFSNVHRSTETLTTSKTHLNKTNGSKSEQQVPVVRVNSFRPAPVVRGFKTIINENANSRLSWSPPSNYNTMPSKPKESFTTNAHVPFSQSNLRRTESSKIVEKNNSYNAEIKSETPVDLILENNSYKSLPSITKHQSKPPPPPVMPKMNVRKPTESFEPSLAERDQLLTAIRNFGGKKGLKSVKV